MKFYIDCSEIAALYIDDEHKTIRQVLAWLRSKRSDNDRAVCDYGQEDGRRVVDESVRKCNKFSNVDVAFRDVVGVLARVNGSRLGRVTLLEYTAGGAFDTHTDKMEMRNQIGTLVLIPPKNVNAFTGGTLIIRENERVTAHETKWTVAFIPAAAPHRVTKVTRGTRIVFRAAVQKAKVTSSSSSSSSSTSTTRVRAKTQKTRNIATKTTCKKPTAAARKKPTTRARTQKRRTFRSHGGRKN